MYIPICCNLLYANNVLIRLLHIILFLTVGEDYTAIASETVTFAPGETCVSVVVSVTDDEVHEKDETFVGLLKASNSTPDNVLIEDPSMAVGNITDDDELSKSMDL